MVEGAQAADTKGGEAWAAAARRRLGRLGRHWTLEQVLVLAGLVTMVPALVALTGRDVFLLTQSFLLLLPGALFTVLLFRRPQGWAYLAAGITNSLLAIIAIPFGLVAVLTSPLSDPRYAGFVLAALSLLLALPAGISGFLRTRRRMPLRPLAEGIHTLHGFAAVSVVALSVGALAAGFFASQNLGTPPPGDVIDFEPPGKVPVVIANREFIPSSLTITAGIVTRITVLNEDNARHTFTYAFNGTEYSHELPPGATTRFFVLFPEPTSIPFWSIPDEGMTGEMTIVPA